MSVKLKFMSRFSDEYGESIINKTFTIWCKNLEIRLLVPLFGRKLFMYGECFIHLDHQSSPLDYYENIILKRL